MGESNTPATAAIENSARFGVRPATLDDADALARLSNQLGYPASREQVERRLGEILANPEHAIFVAEAGFAPEAGRESQGGAGLAGWVHAFAERTVESDPTVEIGGLVVDDARRGAGVGRLLMDQAERWARETGCATITVRSNVIREHAHAFYERLGYAPVKTQRVFRKPIAQ
ncbi:MAG TPA: GNAT family N-acetyltransferase [Terriglobia bacterium]|nr:GNAT family N-acetyltransferase [Terriglobia bacterium]